MCELVGVGAVWCFGREEVTSVSIHFGNNEIQDVTLVCDDGAVLAHRVVLGASSLSIG